MLNPGATEFKPSLTKPSQTDTMSNGTNKPSPLAKTNETQQQHGNKTTTRNSKTRKQKPASHATSANVTKNPDATSNDRTSGHGGNNTVTTSASSVPQQQGDHPKAPRKKQPSKQKAPTAAQPQQKNPARQTQAQQQRRPPPSTTATTTAAAASPDPYEHEPTTSFITIDQTIDPVQVTAGALSLKNTVIHGYDRYIAWIERCLQAHAVVTIVGMDPAISDVLSLVTIIQAKGIGSYHELATFSMDEPGGGRQRQHPISGIQLKLHRN